MSEFPAHWDFKSIGDFASRVRTKNTGGECQDPMTISAIDGLVTQRDYFNKIVASKNTEGYTLLHKNDFAYNKSYSDGYPVGAVRRLKTKDRGIVSPLYICFELDREQIDLQFADYLFASDWFVQAIYGIAKEGARSHGLLNIGIEEFFSASLPIPPLPEQKKIAEILSGIDKVLTSLQLHADKLRLTRDEVVATFFSDESKSDEIAEIRSFGEIVTGSTPPTNNPLNYGGAMPFISPGDIGDSAVVAETKSTLSAAGAAMSRVIPPSSVCVVCIGSTIGKVALTTTESATNQQINALTPGAYDPFFMLAAITHMRNEIRNAASTHAVPIINKSRFGEISIPKPNIERQRQFGSYISSSHKMLSQIMMEIQKYQYLKKAVASDLLSGRKRVSI